MTIPALTDEQRRHLGRVLWTHIDGVAGNVSHLLHAINTDARCGVQVVATQEWEKLHDALRSLQEIVRQFDLPVPELSSNALLSRLSDLLPSGSLALPQPRKSWIV